MSDLIDRQAAIDAILGQPPEPHYPSWYAEQIKNLPPAQPEHNPDDERKIADLHKMVNYLLSRLEQRRDIVYRQDVEEMLRNALPSRGMWEIEGDVVKQTVCETLADALMDLEKLPSVQPEILACGNGELNAQPEQRWIPVSEKLPDDLEEVNITFTNLAPEPYYDFIKGKRFTGSAVFYEGEWYWYSSITVDVLKEYGRYESEKIDEGLKIVAWMSLPEPYRGEENENR